MKVLSVDFFELMGLPRQFLIDTNQLTQHWLNLQKTVHPDKHTGQSDTEKRFAMQAAVRINEAYQTLQHPARRAEYLCEINGVALNLENNTAMPADFLVQQMDWRETLESLKTKSDLSGLNALQAEVSLTLTEQQAQVANQLDTEKNYKAAAATIRQMRFVEKFLQEIDDLLATLPS